jgi:hypothetical protein
VRSAAALVVLSLVLTVPALGQDKAECTKNGQPNFNVPNFAMNCPSLFAWTKFIEVVSPAGNGLVAFQTFSSDTDTFQCPPADLATCKANPNAKGCPVWPSQPTPKFSKFTQRSARFAMKNQPANPELISTHKKPIVPEQDCWNYYNTNAQELVYRNKATFDYIAQNGLWYVEGVEQAFEKGFVFDFPLDSIEVKTNWLLYDSQVMPGQYFTMEYTPPGGKKQLYALIAMHITTKDLPNWFWATFEHVDNWGRCDFLGCHDSFGFTPHDIPSRPKELCQHYPAGEINPALKAMMAKLSPVFQNYRLKGTMTDFTSPTGTPNLLGNSVTEAGFVQTASCMTCHARAATQATAGPPQGLSPYPNIAGFTPTGQSYHGTPDPNWYYSNNQPLTRWSVQTDFVWAVPFKANSLSATAACCQALGTANASGPACQ